MVCAVGNTMRDRTEAQSSTDFFSEVARLINTQPESEIRIVWL